MFHVYAALRASVGETAMKTRRKAGNAGGAMKSVTVAAARDLVAREEHAEMIN